MKGPRDEQTSLVEYDERAGPNRSHPAISLNAKRKSKGIGRRVTALSAIYLHCSALITQPAIQLATVTDALEESTQWHYKDERAEFYG